MRVDEVAEAALEDVRPLAEARGLDVVVETTPVACLGDRDQLLDAITNVVSNAIHYNVPGGNLRVHVRDTGGNAEIVVSDTGIGIAEERLAPIFEPFFRARDRAAARRGDLMFQ